MRPLLFLALAALAAPAAAQNVDTTLASHRLDRAVWESAGRSVRAFERVFDLEGYADEPLSDRLRRVRRRAYGAGREAATALAFVHALAALRSARHDAVTSCAEERALAQHLDVLITAGDDIVEVDETLVLDDGPFDPVALGARMESIVAPVRALVAAHLPPEDPCATVPAPHVEPEHAP